MRARRIALAISVILATVGSALAQEDEAEPDFGRPGWYVGGGFVYGFENFDLDNVSNFTGLDVSASGSPGIDVRGGYRFNQWVALEGNLDYYANFNIDADGVEVLNADAFSFFANAKGYPLGGRVQPYGLFGIGVLAAQLYDFNDYGYGYSYNVSDVSAVFAIRLGAGLDVYVTPKFLLNLDAGYVFATSDMNFGGIEVGTDLIPLAFTAQYRF